MLDIETINLYTENDKQTLKSSLNKSQSYLELIPQIKLELTEQLSSILSEIEVSYQIIFDKVEFEKKRIVDYVSKEFDVKLTEVTRLELELSNLRQEVVELVEQDIQFNSKQSEDETIRVSVSDDTFENQFLSINSIHSLHSYLSNMLLGELEIPEYKLEIDQLSISTLLTGRLVPEKVTKYERDFSKVELPLRYVGLSDRRKSSTSYIHDVTIGCQGDIYTLDRGNSQVHIFDSDFDYKYSFGKKGDQIGEFLCPWSISFCPHTNRILISDCIQASLQSFDLDSELVQRVLFGTIEKYAQIGGICVGIEGVVYVTHSWENCIRVLTSRFQEISEIGKNILTAPKDVKVLKDEVFVLEAIQPHIKVFSTDKSYLHEIHTNMFLSNPWFFCVDPITENFLITEYTRHQVRVVNKQGSVIHTFAENILSFPGGIVVNSNNKQILVCDSLHLRLVVF